MFGASDWIELFVLCSAVDTTRMLITFPAMKTRWWIVGLPILALVSCASDEVREGPKPPPAAEEWKIADPDHLKFSATEVPGGLDISEKGKLVSRVRCATPIQRWVFVKEGRNLVVRCSNPTGPATIQLFDSCTAILRDSIPADQVLDGRPAWAACLADVRP